MRDMKELLRAFSFIDIAYDVHSKQVCVSRCNMFVFEIVFVEQKHQMLIKTVKPCQEL